LGYQTAFRGGLSIGLDNIIVPAEKPKLVNDAKKEVEEVHLNEMAKAYKESTVQAQ
jgi:DNA-directed RNA polymerase subunit beta'